MINTSDAHLAFDAPLFYLGFECLIVFLIFISAMLFKERLTKEQVGMSKIFSPIALWIVGCVKLAVVCATLALLPAPPLWLLTIPKFAGLLLCWSLALHFMAYAPNWKNWPDIFRLFLLVFGTLYAIHNFGYQIVTGDYSNCGWGTAICWLTAFSMDYNRPRPIVTLPISYSSFCLLGFLSYIVLAAGSLQPLDGPFFLSMMIRLSQYALLAFSMLLVRFFGYSLQTWTDREAVIDSRQRCENAKKEIDATRRLVAEAQSFLQTSNVESN